MEKLVDKKQTVLGFMKAVNVLVKMKSDFTVFSGQLLTQFSRGDQGQVLYTLKTIQKVVFTMRRTPFFFGPVVKLDWKR